MTIDQRIASMLGHHVTAIASDRQRVIRGVLVARESALGVVEIPLRGCRARRRFHLRFVNREWLPG